jgi:hypothetical protein
MSIRTGTKVIHNGEEKEITEVHGDVLILNDKTVVSSGDVSIIGDTNGNVAEPQERESEELTEMRRTERASLRARIEGITRDIAAVNLFRIANDLGLVVGGVYQTPVGDEFDAERTKRDFLAIGVRTGKIDPKTCETCGQTVEE